MQATSRAGAPDRAPSDEQALVDALYEIAVATRRLSGRDRVDTGAVRLLWHLAEAGTCRLSDLAEAAGLDLSTVSRHVRDLDEAGYLARTPDAHDRRAVALSISVEGREVLAEARTSRAAALAPVLGAWDSTDRDDLTRLLARLARDLGAETARPGTTASAERTTTLTTDSEDPA